MTEGKNSQAKRFMDRVEAVSDLESIVGGLNPRSEKQDPLKRASARNKAIAYYKESALASAGDLTEQERARMERELDDMCLKTNAPENHVQEALLAEFARASRYYTENKRQILNEIPKSRLEENAFNITPYEIKGNKAHNAAAKAHMEYLALTNLASKVNKGEATAEEVRKLDDAILRDTDKNTRSRLKENGEKDEKYINFMAALERRATYSILRTQGGAHESHALRLARKAKKDFEGAFTKNGSYTVADYVRSNLAALSEEDGRTGMITTYNLLAKQDDGN